MYLLSPDQIIQSLDGFDSKTLLDLLAKQKFDLNRQ